ncbi:MAG TPA: gamma-glutamyl-gamma-aminobutyrate hydrolase family protein [Pseudomonas xinjiangensis]|uniref:gamma-glutamyl-gamma-aminobutyrate hydrolase n=2 Tax=root TaxID=1 RepID=A0A7V1BM63_9GAMM|nr:gamma-glutamyl-gamma-aminobutyrate hydrolase family protein [Halopseudomonas xinjiangensis]HEC46127.1 gamma-glutamyl-gamma-aminobutyrate hydrolase family protein [Halopseudomonas xinjiangensis]
MSAELKPLIGISCCTDKTGLHPFHIVGEKYILGVVNGAGGLPLLIPALGDRLDVDQLLDSLHGLMFTGSPSNVEPHHYGGSASAEGTRHDAQRDATTLPLIKTAIERGVPVLGLCRGFQEMNVAFGGTLHQRLHELEGYIEHREDKTQPVDVQYGLAHEVHIEPGGLLYELSGCSSARVNSLHTQGIDRLAPGLQPEATAPDGLIEAFSVTHAPNFALGVQWHPEWKVETSTFYLSIFKAFGNACRARAAQRIL